VEVVKQPRRDFFSKVAGIPGRRHSSNIFKVCRPVPPGADQSSIRSDNPLALGQECFSSEMVVGRQPVDGGALFPFLTQFKVIPRISCDSRVIQPQTIA
jgi:hypothetical protein